MNTIEVFGHDRQIELLKKNIDSKRNFPFLLYGSEGIGKKLTVQKIIDWHINRLNKHKINNIKRSCIFEYNVDKKMMIEDVRNLIKETCLTNFSDKYYKYLIIDNFELLNLNSQNALLKTLEEPPEIIKFFIITHDLLSLPNTITSRCSQIKFENLNLNDFCNFLKFKKLQFLVEDNARIFNFCAGSPGVFNYLIKNDSEFLIIKKIEEIINENSLDFNKVKELVEYYSEDTFLLTNLIKRYVFQKAKELLLQNNESKEIFFNIIKFFDCLKIKIDTILNIDANHEISLIFINFFKYVKFK